MALAAGIKAERCDIYTDVDGVYTSDPRVVPRAKRLEKIAFEEMLELASLGAKVLQVRSVELGMVHNVRIFVRSSFDKPEDIDPFANHPPGTLICDESEIMEQQVVTGIAFSKDEAQISIRHVPDKPGVAAAIFGPLAEANVNVDMIVQNTSKAGTTDISFTVPRADLGVAEEIVWRVAAEVGATGVSHGADIAKVSLIGAGMKTSPGVAAKMFRTLADGGINIEMISTSTIRTTVVVPARDMQAAVQSLHTAFGLDSGNDYGGPLPERR